jgi:hypothetical protein
MRNLGTSKCPPPPLPQQRDHTFLSKNEIQTPDIIFPYTDRADALGLRVTQFIRRPAGHDLCFQGGCYGHRIGRDEGISRTWLVMQTIQDVKLTKYSSSLRYDRLPPGIDLFPIRRTDNQGGHRSMSR